MTVFDASRRLFVRQSAAVSLLHGAAAPWALNLASMSAAAAESGADYKALVCVFLFGGNDAFNTVLATDARSWASYVGLRNAAPDPLALLPPGAPPRADAPADSQARYGGVLPITPRNSQGRSYALHPSLRSLQKMFDADKLAIVANVGPLAVPTTKAQYLGFTHPRPAKLFSHNDQQSQWQAMAAEGAARGWGGRMADLLQSANSAAGFTAISTFGSAVWLSGQEVRQYQVTPNGPIRIATDPGGSLFGSQRIGEALHRVVSQAYGAQVLEADYAAVSRRSIAAERALAAALPGQTDARWATPPGQRRYDALLDPLLLYSRPADRSQVLNPLAHQLQLVARVVQAGLDGTLGVRRQVFFVGLGGLDTHKDQNATHADILTKLDHGLQYFDTVLGRLGARANVTTFTASDFGRSFTSNGNGTDHGWGGHHFVMGAAVKGGDIYGNFPVLGPKNVKDNGFDSSPNQIANGVLLPELSVDQYGATLGAWFGLSPSQLLEVFPALSEYDTRDLHFMA